MTETIVDWFYMMDALDAAIADANAVEMVWYKERLESFVKEIRRLQGLIIGEKAALNNLPSQEDRVSDVEIERARQYPFHELHVFGRQHGRTRVGLCPFHSEKTGSFTLYDDNHVHCFGCGWNGDPIAFVMQKDGRTFAEAVRRLS
jgi:hypothetical protein